MSGDADEHKKQQSLFDVATHEDDLVCVILLTSWLDSALKDLLQSYFVKCGTSKNIFEHNGGALNSLAAKAKVAYCVGLISKNFFKNVNAVGDIRNLFAHTTDATFESGEVRKKCVDLIAPQKSFVSDPGEKHQVRQYISPGWPAAGRDRFQAIVHVMVEDLIGDLERIEHVKKKRDRWTC